MSSNNTRRIFVNVLVNGNIYQRRVAIDIKEKLNCSESEYIQNTILVVYGSRIPRELLSYEIVSEVSEEQQKTLNLLAYCLSFVQENDDNQNIYKSMSNENGVLTFDSVYLGKKFTIHAKDIVIKE